MANSNRGWSSTLICISVLLGIALSASGGGIADAEGQEGAPGVALVQSEGESGQPSTASSPLAGCQACIQRGFIPFIERIYPKPEIAIGAWIPPVWGQYAGQIDAFENSTQKHHGMYKIYMPWKDPYNGNWIPFSTPMCQYCATMQWQAETIVQNGSVPMINWLSLHCGLDPIKNGTYDWFIRQFARDVRDWGHRILINWGHEMNIPEYPWSTSDTAKYKATFRHIVTIFREEGADNVEFVWSPNYMSHIYPHYSNYYPGDDYVDWVGVDGYNWGSSDPRNPFRTWATFDMIFGPVLDDFSTRYPGKPQMVSETSCTEESDKKAQWITDAYGAMRNYRWTGLKAVFWFNEKKEKPWPADSSSASLQAYREAVNGSFFDGP